MLQVHERERKTYKNQGKVESCSTRTMDYGNGPARHGAHQQLQPYVCDASESILIGSG